MGDRCTGQCCRAFFLPYSPEALDALAARQPDEETLQVHGMVVHLGLFDVNPAGGLNPVPCHYYTCKHFDEPSGNCGIYETRPKMCRDFPYGKPCPFPDCGWDDVVAGDFEVEVPVSKFLRAARKANPEYKLLKVVTG